MKLYLFIEIYFLHQSIKRILNNFKTNNFKELKKKKTNKITFLLFWFIFNGPFWSKLKIKQKTQPYSEIPIFHEKSQNFCNKKLTYTLLFFILMSFSWKKNLITIIFEKNVKRIIFLFLKTIFIFKNNFLFKK